MDRRGEERRRCDLHSLPGRVLRLVRHPPNTARIRPFHALNTTPGLPAPTVHSQSRSSNVDIAWWTASRRTKTHWMWFCAPRRTLQSEALSTISTGGPQARKQVALPLSYLLLVPPAMLLSSSSSRAPLDSWWCMEWMVRFPSLQASVRVLLSCAFCSCSCAPFSDTHLRPVPLPSFPYLFSLFLLLPPPLRSSSAFPLLFLLLQCPAEESAHPQQSAPLGTPPYLAPTQQGTLSYLAHTSGTSAVSRLSLHPIHWAISCTLSS